MPATDLPFTHAEYAARLARVRARMEAAGLDALVTVDPSNMSWITGYDGWSFYVHQAVVVTLTDDPFWWGRRMDAFGALRTVWMAPERILSYPDNYVMSTERHPMQHLAGLLRERGLAAARIGVEMENYYYSARAHAVLGASLPDATLADATALVNWCRIVKSPAEIALMRRAARIVERMHARIFEIVEPGVRRCDVAAEIFATGIRGTPEYGGDYPAIVPLMPGGADASAAHLTWNDRPFQKGEGTFFEIAGCCRRYHAPLCRTIYLGTPGDEWRRAEEAVLEGTERALEAARPGNTAGDIARGFYDVLARRGIAREGRCGYPIGLSYPPDWGERTASIRPEDTTVLEAGMTFHFMPALWMEDWGLEITEPLLVREGGPAECLGDVPRKLLVKD